VFIGLPLFLSEYPTGTIAVSSFRVYQHVVLQRCIDICLRANRAVGVEEELRTVEAEVLGNLEVEPPPAFGAEECEGGGAEEGDAGDERDERGDRGCARWVEGAFDDEVGEGAEEVAGWEVEWDGSLCWGEDNPLLG
jgi:hypothetical protein